MRPSFCGNTDNFVVPTEYGLEIWSAKGRLATLRELTHVTQTSRVIAFGVSGDGKTIVAGTCDGDVLVWEVSTPHEVKRVALDADTLSKGSLRAIALALGSKSSGVVLLKQDIAIVDVAELTAYAIEGVTLPSEPGGIACSEDCSIVAVSSPTEIVVYWISKESPKYVARSCSLVGHLQCPHIMVFHMSHTLLSADAKVRGVLRWKEGIASVTDDVSNVHYCDACWTHAAVEEIVPNGIFALLLHKDTSISIWRIDTDEKVQTFGAIASNLQLARAVSPTLFRVAFVEFSGHILYGDIRFDDATWRLTTYSRENMNSTAAHSRRWTAKEEISSTLPHYSPGVVNMDGASDKSGPSGIRFARLHQALSAGDQSEFESFLIGNTKQFVAECVQVVADHEVSALIRSLTVAVQHSDTVESFAIALEWIHQILDVKKGYFLRMDPSQRKALLSPVRVIMGEFAQHEDALHSYASRLECLHELQLLYAERSDYQHGRKQSKKRYFFRLQ